MLKDFIGYAVVIGIGADLPETVSDAHGLADLLCDPTRCAYPVDNVTLLTKENADRKNILAALEQIALQSQINPDATVIIYFSGHGMETPVYYLLPFGYNLSNLNNTAITGEEFTDRLRSIQAKRLVVILDCCHAGGMAEAKAIPKSPLPSSAINELTKSSGRVVIASSHKDELSWTGNPYSVFTAALLEAFSGYGSFEQDGFARVLDIAMWVGRKVPEYTNDRQHPIIKISNIEDNFALAYYAAGKKIPKKLNWTISAINNRFVSGVTPPITQQRMLANYRENLLLIEERMSQYVEFTAIPLQLIKNKRQIEIQIIDLENKLRLLKF